MQLAKCKVQLAGNRNNEVLVNNVTPAQVILLKSLHGDHAVNEVVVTGNAEGRDPSEEKSRLAQMYNKPNKNVAEKLFPGAIPTLPKTFEEAKIPYELAPPKPHEKGNIVPVKNGKADIVTDAEKEAIKEEKSTVTKTADKGSSPDVPKKPVAKVD